MASDLRHWINIWNSRHIMLVSKGITGNARNENMANYLEDLIIKAKKSYYETGEPIMTDMAYDWHENRLKTLRPKSKVLEKVGS